MKNKLKITFVLLFLALSISLYSQIKSDTTLFNKDSLKLTKIKEMKSNHFTKSDTLTKSIYKPEPSKSVWMGAIVPGLGQVLNKKYWKLPIVYAGFAGCIYAVGWNDGMYASYRSAYRDIIDSDPTTNSYVTLLGKKGYSVQQLGIGNATTFLKSSQDYYRRNRDMSILITIGFYALTLVDAYVDAQLFDFDITPNLTLHIQPSMQQLSFISGNNFELQCCLTLR